MKAFLIAAGERALKTFAQVLLTFFTTDQTGVMTTSWPKALAAAGIAALISVVMSFGSIPFGPGSSPSLTTER